MYTIYQERRGLQERHYPHAVRQECLFPRIRRKKNNPTTRPAFPGTGVPWVSQWRNGGAAPSRQPVEWNGPSSRLRVRGGGSLAGAAFLTSAGRLDATRHLGSISWNLGFLARQVEKRRGASSEEATLTGSHAIAIIAAPIPQETGDESQPNLPRLSLAHVHQCR